MRVRYKMHIDLSLHDPRASVVLAVLRERVRWGSARLRRLVGPVLNGGRTVTQSSAVGHGQLFWCKGLNHVAVCVVPAVGLREIEPEEQQREDGHDAG